MEVALNNVSPITYNCRGLKSSMLDVQNLLNDYQIIFLHETWLAKQQLDNSSRLGVSHFAFGRADYDSDDGLDLGHLFNEYWTRTLTMCSEKNPNYDCAKVSH